MICGPINEALDVTVEVVFVRRWSTIAAQLPGRTDNEIKNYWNTHLKKQLLRMGLNPDTYASNASPCSSPLPSTRHMAQWESARLEAEARLSRESLLFSSSNSASASSSTPSSSTALSASNSTLFTSKPEPDFFLRIWHSEVGDAFRKTIREPADSSLDSSSTKQSFAVVAPAVAEGERREETEIKICGAEASAAAAGSDSSSSYDMEEDASEETYRLYLDFTNDDMALFHGHMAGFSLFSDLNEASLDTAFK